MNKKIEREVPLTASDFFSVPFLNEDKVPNNNPNIFLCLCCSSGLSITSFLAFSSFGRIALATLTTDVKLDYDHVNNLIK